MSDAIRAVYSINGHSDEYNGFDVDADEFDDNSISLTSSFLLSY